VTRPDVTVVTELPVVPLALACTSTDPSPVVVDSPAYSIAAMPTSAVEVGRAVIVGLVPPPTVTTAVQTLSSVWSGARTLVTSV